MPSIGLLMRMSFHVTCVCEGPVPRNDTVERVARPYCLTKSGELNVSTSATERAIFCRRTVESKRMRSTPIDFIGRRPHTGTSRIGIVRAAGLSSEVSEMAPEGISEGVPEEEPGSRMKSVPGSVPIPVSEGIPSRGRACAGRAAQSSTRPAAPARRRRQRADG